MHRVELEATQEADNSARPDLPAQITPGGGLDQTPPPDHEGWVEACANGIRATRERWERRRRNEIERAMTEASAQEASDLEPPRLRPRIGVHKDLDQTPPPDHEEFELVSAAGLRAIKERRERRLRKP